MPGVIKMKHAFKTPGLREIAKRSPFMHDGSLATLEAVVDHYDRGGVDRPSRSDLVKPLGLTPQEKSELVAFLKTLSSNLDPTTVPVLPR
jgi:cytochrome c peroxidase